MTVPGTIAVAVAVAVTVTVTVNVTVPVRVAVACGESFTLAYRRRVLRQRFSPLLFRLPEEGGGAVVRVLKGRARVSVRDYNTRLIFPGTLLGITITPHG